MQTPETPEVASVLPHPLELEVAEWSEYDLIIDARSPHEYDHDHLPGAVNLPVVDDREYAEVGTRHKDDPHSAYLIGVEYSLQNMARHLPMVARHSRDARFLVYCFRGGKRSKLWADNLRTIGYQVDVLRGGWKNYRRWVLAALATLPSQFEFRVLSGATGSGKTRLLHALRDGGEQVLDLEDIARHRGSLIGALPGVQQPSQKLFDSFLLDALRHFTTDRVVWVEAESKKIGNVQLPGSLHDAMHRTTPIHIAAPMAERVRLWREDYPHLVEDPQGMVDRLAPLKPLLGGEELDAWRDLAATGRVDELFERVMTAHYDPCYEQSTKRSYRTAAEAERVELRSLQPAELAEVAKQLARGFGF